MTPSVRIFRPGPPAAGYATLEIEMVAEKSAVISTMARSPLKLLIPRARGESVWAFLSSFGGGLVAGDETRLDLKVGAGAKCFLGTQASTKVYRNPEGRPCGHTMHASVGEAALLVMMPDVIQPFAESFYSQHQEFHLDATAGLVLLDWVASGRSARGERWAFQRFCSRNEIFVGGERRLLDALLLEESAGTAKLPQRMGRYQCIASVLLLGPPVDAAAGTLLTEVGALEVQRRAPVILSASQVTGGVLVRIAGETTEMVRQELSRLLAFIPSCLGEDPWARKW